MNESEDRRRGGDRRKSPLRGGDRRKKKVPVKVERRSGKERRATDRRARQDRRRLEKP
jgi:hypothetical protein